MAGNFREPPWQMNEYGGPPWQMNEYFMPSTTTQMPPSSYGNINENPYNHLDESTTWTHRLEALEFQRPASMNQVVPPSCIGCNAPDHVLKDCPLLMNPIENSCAQVNATYQRPINDPYAPTHNPGWEDHSNFSWSQNPNVGGPSFNQQNPWPNPVINNTPPASYQESCPICASSTHHVSECPTAAQFPPFIQEQIQAIQGYPMPVNSFSNTYNPSWGNHPDFSWGCHQTQAQTQIPHIQNFQSEPEFQNYAYNSGQPSQPIQPPYHDQSTYPPPQQSDLTDDQFNRLEQLIMSQNQSIMSQQQSIARMEAQIGQIIEAKMRRELGQLPSQLIANSRDNLPDLQPNDPPTNPQFENATDIHELESERILKDTDQDQVKEASTDASQYVNLEEEVSTDTNHIEESEPRTSTDTSSNLSENEEGKERTNEVLIRDLTFSTWVCEKIWIRDLKPTAIIVHLVDNFLMLPCGLTEEVPVSQGHFPIDFLTLDIEPPHKLNLNSVISKCPFLATVNANINYRMGVINNSFGDQDQNVRMNVLNPLKNNQEEESWSLEDLIEKIIESDFSSNVIKKPRGLSEPFDPGGDYTV